MSLLSTLYIANNEYLEHMGGQAFLRMILPFEVQVRLQQGPERNANGEVTIRDAGNIIDTGDIGYRRAYRVKNQLIYMYARPSYQAEIIEKITHYTNNNIMTADNENRWNFLRELADELRGGGNENERLVNLIEYVNYRNNEEVRDVIYYYVHYAVTGMYPETFAFKMYANYEKDWEEYRRLVLEGVGVHSVVGMALLYSLAERGLYERVEDGKKPNICALVAVADLEFYGKGRSGKRNIPYSYMCYKKVLDMNPNNPQAVFAIANMMWAYERLRSDCGYSFRIDEFHTLKYCEAEIGEKMKFTPKWYEDIIKFAMTSARFGSAAGANLLGLIILADQDQFPAEYKEVLSQEDAKEYFLRAATMGSPFGYTNLAKMTSVKANETEDSEMKKELMDEAMKYLKQAAEMGIPYASNKVSQAYLGLDRDIKVNKNLNKAFKYAKKALLYSSLMHGAYYPYYNIVKYFYSNEDSPHMGEISIKEQEEYLKIAEKEASGIDEKERELFMEKLKDLREHIEERKGYRH